MLSDKKIKELVEYWINNSKTKLKSMRKLYENKCYADALYYGHMILEMALKALVVAETEEYAPKIHNLNRLAELAKIELTEDESKLLSRSNRFNLEGRYPNEKLEFYKICTESYTDEFYKPIISLHKKLCQKTK